MGRFFNLDSPVMRFLSRMADVMILNILVLITCIPIITVGASLSALHYVLIKMVRDEETYIFKMYFKAFKQNFLQGTVLWIIVVIVGFIFGFDAYIFVHGSETGLVFPWPVVVAVLAVAVIYVMTVMYVFPLQARFINTVGKTLKNAFLMMILNFPKSVVMLVLYCMPVVLLFVSSFAMPFLIMFGIAGPSLGAVYLYRKIFERFEPETEKITSDMDFSVVLDDEETNEETAVETDVETEGEENC